MNTLFHIGLDSSSVKQASAVIFDMDGVIIDSEPLHSRLETQIFDELGITVSPDEHQSYLGTNSTQMFTEIKKRHHLPQSVPALVENERRRFLELLTTQGVPLISGIRPLLHRLAAAGFELALASSAPHEQIDAVMEIGALAPFFPVRVSGDDVPMSKPHPEIFLRAAAALRARPEHCWVIEDSEAGVLAAERAGMRCIALLPAASAPFTAPRPADPSAPQPQNLSRALHIVPALAQAGEIIIESQS